MIRWLSVKAERPITWSLRHNPIPVTWSGHVMVGMWWLGGGVPYDDTYSYVSAYSRARANKSMSEIAQNCMRPPQVWKQWRLSTDTNEPTCSSSATWQVHLPASRRAAIHVCNRVDRGRSDDHDHDKDDARVTQTWVGQQRTCLRRDSGQSKFCVDLSAHGFFPFMSSCTIHIPVSMNVIAFAFASSNAVTHLCLSISDPALRWNVWVPAKENAQDVKDQKNFRGNTHLKHAKFLTERISIKWERQYFQRQQDLLCTSHWQWGHKSRTAVSVQLFWCPKTNVDMCSLMLLRSPPAPTRSTCCQKRSLQRPTQRWRTLPHEKGTFDLPPLEITKLHESSVWMKAFARLIVPRQVCAISAWFLKNKKEVFIVVGQPGWSVQNRDPWREGFVALWNDDTQQETTAAEFCEARVHVPRTTSTLRQGKGRAPRTHHVITSYHHVTM